MYSSTIMTRARVHRMLALWLATCEVTSPFVIDFVIVTVVTTMSTSGLKVGMSLSVTAQMRSVIRENVTTSRPSTLRFPIQRGVC